MTQEFLWVQKYRPKTVADTILPVHLKETFQNFVNQKNIPNLLLHGKSGVGKTTIAKAMLEELGCDYIVINASMKGNIDTLRVEIQNYASTMSMSGGRKYVILDEADALNPNSTQPALRNFMETFSSNCGFILTCNVPSKIIDALHSRCAVVDFTIPKMEKPILAKEFIVRVFHILKTENVEYDKSVIIEVVKKFFPDWRRCINELQRYSSTGKIDTGILASFQDISLKKLIESMKSKDFTAVRTWVAENSDMDTERFFRKLYDASTSYFTPIGTAQLILLLGKYQYQDSFVANKEINIAAMCVEIIIECEFK
jgi:DNA polymerase III delta prime subunit